MANITLAGTLRDPNGDLAVGDKIRFTHKSTTGETVKSASSILTIDPTGVYSVDLEYGLVLVEYKDVRNSQFDNLGVATVNGDNPATSITELLNALVPVSSAELIEFQAILADCVAAKDAAEAAAATLDLVNDLSQAYEFKSESDMRDSGIAFELGKVLHTHTSADTIYSRTWVYKNTAAVSPSDTCTISSVYPDKCFLLRSLGASRFQVGDNPLPAPAALRDVFYASRNVIGDTNCHAFTDNSVLDAVTDVGAYASFDTIATGKGTTSYDHIHGYQERLHYESTGTIQTIIGFYSAPIVESGTVNERVGFDVLDVTVNGGSVLGQVGLRVRDLIGAGINVALSLLQSTGYAIFAPNGAKSYHKGNIGFGLDGGNFKVNWAGNTTSSPAGFLDSDPTNGVTFGTPTDTTIATFINGANRLNVGNSTTGYALYPGADGAQALGLQNKAFKELILSDTANGIAHKVVVTNGVLVVSVA